MGLETIYLILKSIYNFTFYIHFIFFLFHEYKRIDKKEGIF
jgi:hypothetical protein